jgi:hypothetical protein
MAWDRANPGSVAHLGKQRAPNMGGFRWDGTATGAAVLHVWDELLLWFLSDVSFLFGFRTMNPSA